MASRKLAAVCAAITLTALSVSLPAAARPGDKQVSPAEASARFIISYDGTATAQSNNGRAQREKAHERARAHGAQVKDTREMALGAEVVQLDRTLTESEAAAFMQDVLNQPGVTGIEVDRLLKPSSVPSDPSYAANQWDMKAGAGGMNVEPARDIATGRGVTVAVIDTGITPHTEFSGQILTGYDMISDASIARDGNGRDANPNDEGDWIEANDTDCGDGRFHASSWHGSHVAGTIAARTNNGVGVASVAPDAKIVPVRVLGRCGGYSSDIIDGMLWAAGLPVSGTPANANPAKVLNLSLGGNGACSAKQQQAVDAVVARGTSVVVAAGNDNKDAAGFNPGNCRNTINVAASDKNGARSWYSNYGSSIDITGPGGDTSYAGGGIYSTLNSGQRTQGSESYAWYQGTSMATPHIAGLVALMYQAKPSITPAEVERVLKSTARSISCPAGCGAGLADATAALRALGSVPNPTPTPTPTPTPKPTPTPTPTPTPVPSGEVVVNGGFEQGRTAWTGNTVAITTSSYARSGTSLAWLGGYGSARTEQIGQTVTVPSAGKLTFWARISTNEYGSTPYDKLNVQLLDSSGRVLRTLGTLSNADAGSSWRQVSYDVSAYAGQRVEVRFTSVEDSRVSTTFMIDDVSLAGSRA